MKPNLEPRKMCVQQAAKLIGYSCLFCNFLSIIGNDLLTNIKESIFENLIFIKVSRDPLDYCD